MRRVAAVVMVPQMRGPTFLHDLFVVCLTRKVFSLFYIKIYIRLVRNMKINLVKPSLLLLLAPVDVVQPHREAPTQLEDG